MFWKYATNLQKNTELWFPQTVSKQGFPESSIILARAENMHPSIWNAPNIMKTCSNMLKYFNKDSKIIKPIFLFLVSCNCLLFESLKLSWQFPSRLEQISVCSNMLKHFNIFRRILSSSAGPILGVSCISIRVAWKMCSLEMKKCALFSLKMKKNVSFFAWKLKNVLLGTFLISRQYFLLCYLAPKELVFETKPILTVVKKAWNITS